VIYAVNNRRILPSACWIAADFILGTCLLLTSPQPRQLGWPVYLALCAICLALIMTWLGPRSSAGFGILNSLLFWFAHVATGLAILAGVQLLLGRIPRFGSLPSGIQVLIGGFVGAIVFMPAAFGFDLLFQPPFTSDDASEGVASEIWTEFTQGQGQGEEQDVDLSYDSSENQAVEFWQKVPKSLGRDLVAISAELHYLRVHTVTGDALILFAFGRAVELLDDADTCQIHRSHWVRLPHVDDVLTGNGAMTCVMDNGLKLPVSRTYRKALKLGVRSAKVH